MRFAQTVDELLDRGRDETRTSESPESSANEGDDGPGQARPGGDEA